MEWVALQREELLNKKLSFPAFPIELLGIDAH